MGTVIIVLLVAAAVAGLVIGSRHAYFRLSRPHGFECSLRLVRGEMPGLATKFRAGHAGPEMQTLRWRRIAWPGPSVTFPATAVRVDRARRPRAGERLAVPATFTVVPVELDSGTLLELALPTRRVRNLIGLLSGGAGPGAKPPTRRDDIAASRPFLWRRIRRFQGRRGSSSDR